MTNASETPHAPIAAVTVYPDRARVTRRGAVRATSGEQRVRIGPLPLRLHRDSVRVSGLGAATVLGVDLVTEHQAATSDAAVRELEDRRQHLADEVAALDDADRVEEGRAQFMQRLAERAGGTYARALAAGQADATAVAVFADSVAEQLTAAHARRRELAGQARLARDRLAAAERELQQVGRPAREPDHLIAVVTLAAEADTDVELELSYLVEGAGWKSGYDVRVDDSEGSPTLTVTWSGLVTQRTGEDWPECDLRLSTARPAGAIAVPELTPWFLDRVRPAPPPPAPMSAGGALGGLPVPAAARSDRASRPQRALRFDSDPPELATSTASVEQGVAAATYRPARAVAVPADGGAHRTTVETLELPVTLDHITAPVRAAEAYLRAVVVNGSRHTLPAGRASVFHGGDFVAATDLPVWAPGEEVELVLGVDDRIRVERELTRRSAGKAALSATRRREVEHRITVANHTPTLARITVLDQLPVSRDEGITIRETAVDPAPAERTELGILTWKVDLAPGERREITLGVRVELAKGVELAGWRE